MSHEATELKLFIDNDGDLYRQMRTSIDRNLITKKARGIYQHDLAVKGFGYLAEAGAKKYAKEFGGTWHQMFTPAVRREVAEALTRNFEGEAALGNYDYLLPKKYQVPLKAAKEKLSRDVSLLKKAGYGGKKKTAAQVKRDVDEILRRTR
jgi:hypothetical protein